MSPYIKPSRQSRNQLRSPKESAPRQRHQKHRPDTLSFRAAKRAAMEELIA